MNHRSAAGFGTFSPALPIKLTMPTLLTLLALLLAACGGTEDSAGQKAACSSADIRNYTEVKDDPSLMVVSSTPIDCTGGIPLSLDQLKVGFNHPLAAAYDYVYFNEFVDPYLLLEDLSVGLPVLVYTWYDDWTGNLLIYPSRPLEAAHTYRLSLIGGLTAESGPVLAGDTLITFTMDGQVFGTGVYADRVLSYDPELPAGESTGEGYFNAQLTLGQPEFGLNVTSLGGDSQGEGGSITLGLGDGVNRHCIIDRTGADFIVHENPFGIWGTAYNFTEAAFVEVSADNLTWYRFPAVYPDPLDPAIADLAGDPAQFSGLAGINVGGDAFDLAALATLVTPPPAEFQACYVRIVDGGAVVPDYNAYGASSFPDSTGADIDAVEVLHSAIATGLAR
ncbi:MAG: hypothetical protein OEZ59_10940 [Deltaproteobacteria bacterium]|nr:hypothetical protein [Deltaproteobacteria bacterium]